ncbi:MAG TPA: DUF1398 family protein [Bryobacteraceae bacterium]|nr:DUF1398 family protein [Bryobacteraceae bacterium]
MNQALLGELIGKALARKITFPEILATLKQEGVESYHVDFLRNECRYYAKSGESFVTRVPFEHNGVAPEFSAEKLDVVNRRVQSGRAVYADFVREGTAAGCAYYTVYLDGKKVRYFGRDGGEHVQHFPGSR